MRAIGCVAWALALAPAVAAGQGYVQRHVFARPEGASPNSGVAVDAAGNVYGTLALGGRYGAGQIWRLDPAGRLTVLYAFHGGQDGRIPDSAPVIDAQRNLFGTTGFGGASDQGAAWELSPQAGGKWRERVIHSFGAAGDGATPQARLLLGQNGVLYGTTVFGGSAGNGTVFALTQAGGAYGESVLYSFAGGLSDGANPVAGLLADGQGGFYGTTAGGGPGANGGNGTVFHLTPSGQGYANATLHFFAGGPGDGAGTFSQLVADAAGTLYGTTFLGGTHNGGTAFAVTPAGVERVLFNFGGARGRAPFCGLVFDAQGALWGTTYYGGTHGKGAVFALAPSGGVWRERIAWSFAGGADGATSYATLAAAPDGSLVGTTFRGGAENRGTVFAVGGGR